jgi:Double-stranded DNA deaminase toxin A
MVMAAVLWALLNFVYAPSCGRFSCSLVPSWWPQAQAGTGEGCPDSLGEAAKDERWLRDRIESISDRPITVGMVYDEDGEPSTFVSGQDDAAKTAVEVGHEVGAFPPPGSPFTTDHVEVKAAAAMRRADVKRAILVINNPEGPCGLDDARARPYTCDTLVPKLLAPGATLTVFWIEDGKLQSEQYVGGAR